jgi:hypothetical protein
MKRGHPHRIVIASISIALPLIMCTAAGTVTANGGWGSADGRFISDVRESSPGNNQDDIKTYTGTIAKNKGRFVLEESTVGATYAIDDQKAASKYEGKKVIVTGTFDRENKMIHVQKIDELA